MKDEREAFFTRVNKELKEMTTITTLDSQIMTRGGTSSSHISPISRDKMGENDPFFKRGEEDMNRK
jgi:hypothetical protein